MASPGPPLTVPMPTPRLSIGSVSACPTPTEEQGSTASLLREMSMCILHQEDLRAQRMRRRRKLRQQHLCDILPGPKNKEPSLLGVGGLLFCLISVWFSLLFPLYVAEVLRARDYPGREEHSMASRTVTEPGFTPRLCTLNPTLNHGAVPVYSCLSTFSRDSLAFPGNKRRQF